MIALMLIIVGLAGMVQAETLGEKAIREAGNRWVPCSQLYGPQDEECRVNGAYIEVRKPCYPRMQEALREAAYGWAEPKGDLLSWVMPTTSKWALRHEKTIKECVR